MKKLALLLFIGSSALISFAQELNIPPQTQYLADNPFSISPTFAGIGDNARIRINGLTQWVGIKNAPINQSLAADFRITSNDGVGVFVYNDKNGNTRQSGVKFSYAHHIILDYDSEQYLSFGISYNFNQFRIDIQNFDNSAIDPSVTSDRYTRNNNFDLGILYRNKDYYLSLAGTNILKKDLNAFIGVEPSNLRNYQVYTGYRFRQADNNFEVEPSALFQYFESDKRSSTDANVKLKWNNFEDYYWIGATARFINDQGLNPVTAGPIAGLRVKNFYFGYSYQINVNNLLPYNNGTHMITLGFDFLQNISNCPCTQNRIIY